MEFYPKDQSQGAFHKLKSSFNEIFGKSEAKTLEVKSPRETVIDDYFKKTE